MGFPNGFLRLSSSVQQSLIGKITPNLRAINLIFKNDTTYELIFFYDLPLSEDEVRLSMLAYQYVSSDFPEPVFDSSYVVKVLPYPKKIDSEGRCLYERYEEKYNPIE